MQQEQQKKILGDLVIQGREVINKQTIHKNGVEWSSIKHVQAQSIDYIHTAFPKNRPFSSRPPKQSDQI